MRSLDVIRQKRRFEMFNEESKSKVLELNSFFGKYIMHFEDKIKKVFTYYDTPNCDLQKSNIVLYKTQIGNFTELNMATENSATSHRYAVRTQYKHYSIPIKPRDSILKYKQFLIDSFTNMFMSSISFDPEFLMKKLQVAYTIKTTSTEYRSMNVTGLKITYSFDKDEYFNNYTQTSATGNVLTIYQHSGPNTDEDFNNLIDKLVRYCKELTPTKELKIALARNATATKKEMSLMDEIKLDNKKQQAKNAKKNNKKDTKK